MTTNIIQYVLSFLVNTVFEWAPEAKWVAADKTIVKFTLVSLWPIIIITRMIAWFNRNCKW